MKRHQSDHLYPSIVPLLSVENLSSFKAPPLPFRSSLRWSRSSTMRESRLENDRLGFWTQHSTPMRSVRRSTMWCTNNFLTPPSPLTNWCESLSLKKKHRAESGKILDVRLWASVPFRCVYNLSCRFPWRFFTFLAPSTWMRILTFIYIFLTLSFLLYIGMGPCHWWIDKFILSGRLCVCCGSDCVFILFDQPGLGTPNFPALMKLFTDLG